MGKYLLPKAMYAVMFAGFGALLPFLPVFLEERGLDRFQIGLLSAISPTVGSITAVVASYLGDRFRIHKTLLVGSVLACSILCTALVFVQGGLVPLGLLMGGLAAFEVPVFVLTDAFTLCILGPNEDMYGAQRLPGSLSWGAVAPLVGLGTDYFHSIHVVLWTASGFLLLYFLLVAFFLRDMTSYDTENISESEGKCENESEVRREKERETSDYGNKASGSLVNPPGGKKALYGSMEGYDPLSRAEEVESQPHAVKTPLVSPPSTTPAASAPPASVSLFYFVSNIHFVCFYITSFLFGMGMTVVNAFLFIYLDDSLDASATLLGLSIAVTILLEIPIFIYSEQLLDRLGIKAMVVIAHLVCICMGTHTHAHTAVLGCSCFFRFVVSWCFHILTLPTYPSPLSLFVNSLFVNSCSLAIGTFPHPRLIASLPGVHCPRLRVSIPDRSLPGPACRAPTWSYLRSHFPCWNELCIAHGSSRIGSDEHRNLWWYYHRAWCCLRCSWWRVYILHIWSQDSIPLCCC